MSFLIEALVALLSFLLRFWRVSDSFRFASKADIDFLSVVVGEVGEYDRWLPYVVSLVGGAGSEDKVSH